MYCLSPSILSADYGRLGDMIREVDEAGAQYIHIDVMDGMFVPNITIGLPVIKSIRPYTERIFDVHLMIEKPERYIHDFAEAGADIITVHAEACTHLDMAIDLIKKEGLLAGVALNPATPLSAVEHILQKADMILIMSVNPGFGGQTFIDYTLEKIRGLRDMAERKKCSIDIEVDGGVNLANVDRVLTAGANIIVAGSAVFNGDITENVQAFLSRMG